MPTKSTYHRLKCGLNDIIHIKFLATVPSGIWGMLIINIQVLPWEERKPRNKGPGFFGSTLFSTPKAQGTLSPTEAVDRSNHHPFSHKTTHFHSKAGT